MVYIDDSGCHALSVFFDLNSAQTDKLLGQPFQDGMIHIGKINTHHQPSLDKFAVQSIKAWVSTAGPRQNTAGIIHLNPQ